MVEGKGGREEKVRLDVWVIVSVAILMKFSYWNLKCNDHVQDGCLKS